jgi:hypothetical protein
MGKTPVEAVVVLLLVAFTCAIPLALISYSSRIEVDGASIKLVKPILSVTIPI